VLTDAMDREFAILTAARSGRTSDTVR
jgi:hypothetical protein